MSIFRYGPLLLMLLAAGCSTSNHGSFTKSSYSANPSPEGVSLGRVVGESRQTFVFYIFPLGEAPSTNSAILDAKSKIEGTGYLADISIDDRVLWNIGYSEQVIRVEAEAFR